MRIKRILKKLFSRPKRSVKTSIDEENAKWVRDFNDAVCECAKEGLTGRLDELFKNIPKEEINRVVHEVNKTKFFVSPVVAACAFGHPEIVEYLITKYNIPLVPSKSQRRSKNVCDGRKKFSNDLSIFGVAAYFGHITVLDFFLKRKVDVNTGLLPTRGVLKLPVGISLPLHAAVANNQTDIVKYLVKKGANLFITDSKGNNCLMKIDLETQSGEAMLKLLISLGFNINHQNPLNKQSFLHCATREFRLRSNPQHKRMLRFLIEDCSADMTLKDLKGSTPLHYLASKRQNRRAVEQLWNTQKQQHWSAKDHIEFLEMCGALFILTLSYGDLVRDHYGLNWVTKRCWKNALELRKSAGLPKEPQSLIHFGIFGSVKEHTSLEELKMLRKNKAIHNFRLQAALIVTRINKTSCQFSYEEFLDLGFRYRHEGDYCRCFSLYRYVLQKACHKLGSFHPITSEILSHCYGIFRIHSEEFVYEDQSTNSNKIRAMMGVLEETISIVQDILAREGDAKVSHKDSKLIRTVFNSIDNLFYFWSRIRNSIQDEDSKRFHSLVSRLISLDFRTQQGFTLIKLFCSVPLRKESKPVLRLLLDCGADPQLVDQEGKTCLQSLRSNFQSIPNTESIWYDDCVNLIYQHMISFSKNPVDDSSSSDSS